MSSPYYSPLASPTPTAPSRGGRAPADPTLSPSQRQRERVLKNRQSAMKSLAKKKRYTEDLEARAAALGARNDHLKARIRQLLDSMDVGHLGAAGGVLEGLAGIGPVDEDLLPTRFQQRQVAGGQAGGGQASRAQASGGQALGGQARLVGQGGLGAVQPGVVGMHTPIAHTPGEVHSAPPPGAQGAYFYAQMPASAPGCGPGKSGGSGGIGNDGMAELTLAPPAVFGKSQL